MNKKAVVAVAVLVVAAGALFWWLSKRGEEGEGGPLTLYGNVEIREVELAFRQGGRVERVAVEEGDRVAAGDELAALDEEPLSEAVAAAEASVELARARLTRLERGSRPQEIGQAAAAVEEAEARREAARRNLERKRRLLEAGAVSRREAEQAEEAAEAAEARTEAARQALGLAREGSRSEDVAAGQAELEGALARLEQARTALGDARLVAPEGGVILERVAEPGALVAAGAPVVLLSLPEPVVVRAYVDEPNLGKVAPGTAVRVRSDSSSGSFRGRVGFVAPRAEFTPKSVETPELRTDLVYRLRIVVDGAAGALLQGMPVTVTVDEGASPNEPPPEGAAPEGASPRSEAAP